MSQLDLDDLWASMVRQFRVDLREKTVDVALEVFDVGLTELHFSGVTSVTIVRRNTDIWDAVELTEIAGYEDAEGFRFVLSFFGDADRVEVICKAFRIVRAGDAPEDHESG